MIRIDSTDIPPKKMAEILRRMGSRLMDNGEQILDRNGAAIERDAKVLTPVDTGMLRFSINYSILRTDRTLKLKLSSPMKYAAVQHENFKFYHIVGQAKFIEIPFVRQVRKIKMEIVNLIDTEVKA